MRAFRWQDDALVAEVAPGERDVLATVVADVAELLGAGRLEVHDPREGGEVGLRMRLEAVPAPDDPAVHRLLPDASRDDPEVAAEFRRLTEDDLRQDKIARLAELFALLAPDDGEDGGEPDRGHRVRVPRADGPRLAATITDLRLVLGERLGVQDEQAGDLLDDELSGPDPASDDRAAQIRHYLGSVYVALGWWQETLMSCLLADLDRS
ncbi:MAG TPA: DUF2017 family protein [Cellulomonas sp.]